MKKYFLTSLFILPILAALMILGLGMIQPNMAHASGGTTCYGPCAPFTPPTLCNAGGTYPTGQGSFSGTANGTAGVQEFLWIQGRSGCQFAFDAVNFESLLPSGAAAEVSVFSTTSATCVNPVNPVWHYVGYLTSTNPSKVLGGGGTALFVSNPGENACVAFNGAVSGGTEAVNFTAHYY